MKIKLVFAISVTLLLVAFFSAMFAGCQFLNGDNNSGDDKETQSKPLLMEGNKLIFGSYPQSEVEDAVVISQLKATTNKLPSSGNANGWTDYGYYLKGVVQSFAWYVDVELGGARYRGVYFTSYRPWATDSDVGNNYQAYHGYTPGNIYWFKWEPLVWRVLSGSGETLILADSILDIEQFSHEYDTTRTVNGVTVYPNNYAHSDLRKWLNDNFYNSAFDQDSKKYIVQTDVDNSAATTSNTANKYACSNTSDNVFLLSFADLLGSYGFDNAQTRQMKPTPYAKCQSAWVYSDYGRWWLRSPGDINPNAAYYVEYDGKLTAQYTNFAGGGVVPAMHIKLAQ